MTNPRYHKITEKQGSRAGILLFLLVLGCSEGAKLVQETPAGGIVTYPFKGESGYLFTKFRAEAIELIEKRCGGAGQYKIVKEAEAKGRSRIVQDATGGQEAVSERRWGMQFECKLS